MMDPDADEDADREIDSTIQILFTLIVCSSMDFVLEI